MACATFCFPLASTNAPVFRRANVSLLRCHRCLHHRHKHPPSSFIEPCHSLGPRAQEKIHKLQLDSLAYLHFLFFPISLPRPDFPSTNSCKFDFTLIRVMEIVNRRTRVFVVLFTANPSADLITSLVGTRRVVSSITFCQDQIRRQCITALPKW